MFMMDDERGRQFNIGKTFPDRDIRYNVNVFVGSMCGHHHLIVSNIRDYDSALLLI